MRRLLLFWTLLAGCAALSDRATPADAPLLGKADGLDRADHGCNVILREATRLGGDPAGKGWRGTLDLSTALVAEGATAAVLYKEAGASGWQETTAVAGSLYPDGFQRFAFSILSAAASVQVVALAHR